MNIETQLQVSRPGMSKTFHDPWILDIYVLSVTVKAGSSDREKRFRPWNLSILESRKAKSMAKLAVVC